MKELEILIFNDLLILYAKDCEEFIEHNQKIYDKNYEDICLHNYNLSQLVKLLKEEIKDIKSDKLIYLY